MTMTAIAAAATRGWMARRADSILADVFMTMLHRY
jgi:hypothetical protein